MSAEEAVVDLMAKLEASVAQAKLKRDVAALVEAHGRNKVLRALGGSFDCGELDDDEAWVQVWSFPEELSVPATEDGERT